MGNDLLPKGHFQSLRQLEDYYWWHQTRVSVAQALLARCRFRQPALLDLGCGTGAFLETMGKSLTAQRMVGADASPTALEYIRERHLKHVQANLEEPLLVEKDGFQLVAAMDVLEHLRQPGTLVKSAWNNLAPGGFFLASVPAHPFLYSDWDRMLHHVCRFSRKKLKALVEDGGFRIQRLVYAFFAPFFGALAARKLGKNQAEQREEFPPMPKWLNRILLLEGKLEAGWLRWLPLPTGLSLYVLAQKPR